MTRKFPRDYRLSRACTINSASSFKLAILTLLLLFLTFEVLASSANNSNKICEAALEGSATAPEARSATPLQAAVKSMITANESSLDLLSRSFLISEITKSTNQDSTIILIVSDSVKALSDLQKVLKLRHETSSLKIIDQTKEEFQQVLKERDFLSLDRAIQKSQNNVHLVLMHSSHVKQIISIHGEAVKKKHVETGPSRLGSTKIGAVLEIHTGTSAISPAILLLHHFRFNQDIQFLQLRTNSLAPDLEAFAKQLTVQPPKLKPLPESRKPRRVDTQMIEKFADWIRDTPTEELKKTITRTDQWFKTWFSSFRAYHNGLSDTGRPGWWTYFSDEILKKIYETGRIKLPTDFLESHSLNISKALVRVTRQIDFERLGDFEKTVMSLGPAELREKILVDFDWFKSFRANHPATSAKPWWTYFATPVLVKIARTRLIPLPSNLLKELGITDIDANRIPSSSSTNIDFQMIIDFEEWVRSKTDQELATRVLSHKEWFGYWFTFLRKNHPGTAKSNRPGWWTYFSADVVERLRRIDALNIPS